VRGSIGAWGDALQADLEKLTGSFALILVGPGPVQVRPVSDAASLTGVILAARERWGTSFLFHLFSPEVEYRWDHGVGRSLTVGAEGPYEVSTREWFLLADRERYPGVAALHGLAPTGRVKVCEFLEDGQPVDLKLEALI